MDSSLRRIGLLLMFAAFLPLGILGERVQSGAPLLPHAPALLEPLAGDLPDQAAADPDAVVYGPADRVFPALSDQVVARAELRGGSLPTWEPLLGLGAPLFANSIAGLAYPPNWLALVLPPEEAAGALALLSLYLAGLGMGLFLLRLGLSLDAATAGMLAMQVGGYAMANLHYYMKVDAALWLPFGLWAVEGIARGRRWSAAALALSVGFSFLAGFPQVAVFSLAVLGVYAILRLSGWGAALLGVPPDERADAADASFVRLSVRTALALACGLAIGAWQMLPMVEASGESLRRSKSAEDVAREALPTRALLGLLVPDLIASPRALPDENGPAMAWYLTPAEDFEKALTANGTEWNLYAGILPLLLAVGALVGLPRRARAPALGLVLCYGFVCAWPLVRGLYHVPGLGAGAPGRMVSVAWVLWAWLAGLGLEAFGRSNRARVALLAITALFLAGGAVFTLEFDDDAFAADAQAAIFERFQALPEPPSMEVVEAYAPLADLRHAAGRMRAGFRHTTGIAGFLLIGLALYAGIRKVRESAQPYSLLLFVAALPAMVEGMTQFEESLAWQRPGQELFPRTASIEAVADAAGDGRVVRLAAGADTAGLVGAVERLARPNLLQVYGIADLSPWTVFTPAGLVELVAESAHGVGDGLDPEANFRSGIAGLTRADALGHPLLDLLRVTCVLSTTPLEHPRLEPVSAREGFHVYRRDGALPAARIVPAGIASPTDEVARGLLVSGSFDASSGALLAPGLESQPAAPDAAEATITDVSRPAKHRLDLRVEGSRGGLLVMHEQWFPGWKATINGADAEVLRVDHVYRGLWLPEGDLVIRTKYEPWSLRIGFAAALFGLALVAFFGFRLRW